MNKETVKIDTDKLSVILATDCGSTTTKAILFEKKGDAWRQTYRGEAPTTVEKPVADVTIGARNAFREIQELSGRKILKDEIKNGENPLIIGSNNKDEGVDLYLSTSSAGGGLQMVVAGVVSTMTTESAERAALGAGAIVMDAISADDGREPYERVAKIRHLRPDIILLAGGTDGGNVDLPLEIAEIILQADPKPRFGDTLNLPVIYAANSEAKDQAKEILQNRFSFTAVENLRPTLDKENLAPARDAIHELFLNHVMSHAPGYKKLLTWSPVPIIPTPAAVGAMVRSAASERNLEILAVDIGGATTDVFSVFNVEDQPVFNRTVSANLGMSYSVANVMLEAGIDNIARWLPFDIGKYEVKDRLRNKMIRPTSIPQTMEDLLLEQAICREALRLAFIHHKRLAVGLSGGQKQRTIGEMFSQNKEESLVNMMSLDLIIGSGGVLSHAPDRKSSAFMLLDSYEPQGVTKLAVDSIFMMPHLGVLSSIHSKAAAEIFLRDCIVELGTVIAPTYRCKQGKKIARVEFENNEFELAAGELKLIELAVGKSVNAVIKPLDKTVDFGFGKGKTLETTLTGGHAGIILDGRGRPLQFNGTREQIKNWYSTFEIETL